MQRRVPPARADHPPSSPRPPARSHRVSAAQRRVCALAAVLAVLGTACREPPREPQPAQLAAPWQERTKSHVHYADRSAPLAPGAKHVIWFGHSLLVTDPGWPAPDDPALDLPALVADLHDAALRSGRTQTPKGRSITFAEGPYGFAYWLDGQGRARNKLLALADVPWTHVVGVDLIHLLGEGRFAWPNLYEWAGMLSDSESSVRTRTRDVYRFIGLAHETTPSATWVNYVAPALANNPGTQPAIDARFACIRESACALGRPVIDAPVGAAFRTAEQRAAARGITGLTLQHDDFLHLRPHGALLAAQVLFATIYDVDPRGLPVPERYRGKLAPTAEQEQTVTAFLSEVASDTWKGTRARCDDAARVSEDAEAAAWLGR